MEDQKDNRITAVGSGLAHAVIIYLVALLLALPLFIILDPYVPEMVLPIGEGVRVDHAFTFVLILVAFIVLVRRFQLAVYVLLITGMLAITVTSLSGVYGLGDMYNGYAELLRSLRDTSAQVPLAAQRLRPFHDAEKLRALVEDGDPVVRKSAVRMATAHFTDVPLGPDEFTMVQSFSIFKEINSRWKYVSDVKGGEYFATPGESIDLMAGDCDDHALLMAACIKAIGGEVRLVRTEGHVYPELRIGDDEKLERAAYLIRKVLFTNEVGDAPLYHHTDADGQHWINLDYTRHYPGGELMSERIVGILDV
ncbi:MAG: transglutaminase [Flavobacteriales bacterium]